MLQQSIALIIIVFFISRLVWQKKKRQIRLNEFVFWLLFWLLAAIAISFIKQIDSFVARLGFSGSGIDILLYLGVLLLFYMIFKLRLKMEKIDREVTKVVREISLKNKD